MPAPKIDSTTLRRRSYLSDYYRLKTGLDLSQHESFTSSFIRLLAEHVPIRMRPHIVGRIRELYPFCRTLESLEKEFE